MDYFIYNRSLSSLFYVTVLVGGNCRLWLRNTERCQINQHDKIRIRNMPVITLSELIVVYKITSGLILG
jgi:hypothetical protein